MLNSNIKLLKKSPGTQKCFAQRYTPGYAISKKRAKMGVSLQVYTLNHVILVVNANFGSKQYVMINVQYKTERDMPITLSSTKI